MTTRFSEADKPATGLPAYGRDGGQASLSLSLIRAVTVPRLRLWAQALPEIPSRILILIRVVILNPFHNLLKQESADLKRNARIFKGPIQNAASSKQTLKMAECVSMTHRDEEAVKASLLRFTASSPLCAF